MTEASMVDVFNLKVKSFNEAVGADDAVKAARIGRELVDLALGECVKYNISASVKDFYCERASRVVNYLAQKAAASAAAPAKVSGGGEGEVADPYYSERQWFSDEVPALGFKDIIGAQEVKDAFMVDVVAPLLPKFRSVYRQFRGDQMGTQILLYGPPGTGKTHIVKCLAGELNCKIAVVQTSEVLASVVGVAEKNVRDIFAQAAELERCIIFLDEIDSICSDRDSPDSRNTKSVLTTMLTCMDGFIKTTKPNQLRIIVAATNLPWKLDPALKRGGRFETQIYVPVPDEYARLKFVEKGLNGKPHEQDVTVQWLQERLEGFSGADINAIIRQISNAPLRREILNIMNGGKALGEKITRDDCEKVLKDYINPINSEMKLRFKAYSLGISYDQLLLQIARAAEKKNEDKK